MTEITWAGQQIPVGDLVFDVQGVRLGFEICEDSWVAARPGRSLFERQVDVILNPSASHFALGKQQLRSQFVREGILFIFTRFGDIQINLHKLYCSCKFMTYGLMACGVSVGYSSEKFSKQVREFAEV